MDSGAALRRIFRTQWLLAGLALVLIAIGIAYHCLSTHAETGRREQHQLSHLGSLVGQLVERRLSAVDALLTMVAGQYPGYLPPPGELDKLSADMQRYIMLGRGADILLLLDARGEVLASNRPELVAQNFAHRYYFREAKAAVNPENRIISPPFETVLGDYTFTLSRKLVDPDGEFIGVLMATLDAPFISRLLGGVLMSEDMWAALVHGTGVTVLSAPEHRLPDGQDIQRAGGFVAAVPAAHGEQRLLEDAVTLGEPHAVAVMRISPPELQLNQPLIVGVGRNLDAAYANWRRETWALGALYLMLVAAAFFGLRHYQRRVRDDWKQVTRQQALIEMAGDGIHVLDRNGVVVEANPAFLKQLGLDRSDLGRLRVSDFDTVLDETQLARNMQALLARNEEMRIESVHRRRDGSQLDVDVSARGFELDGEMLILASARDISGRKAVEAQLRKLTLAVEQSPESVFITDARARIEYVNPAFVETSGYRADELIGQNPRILASGLTPVEEYRAMWDTLLAGGIWRGEFVNRRKNGETYVEAEIISPIRNPAGEMTHYLAIKQDVTERRRIENELAAYRESLEHKVDERTAALTEANQALAAARDKAEEATRAKAAFLANMSHEIRTPMNGIIGMLHLLRRSGVDEKQSGYLEKIARSADHLLTVINDILDLSKIEAGKLNIEQVPVQPRQIIGNVASMISAAAAAKGLAVVIEPDSLPDGLLGDPTRLTQALLNFASNAVKFTESGRVVLRVGCVGERDDSVVLRFEVEDTGIGIAPEVMGRLFAAFEQADNSTTRIYGGTGLGLALARRLAGLMGGEAAARSVPGQGSCFWFTARLLRGVPERADHEELHRGDAEVRLREQYAGKRVLLVDDEPINQEISAMLLEDVGLQVELADNGLMALEKALFRPYDLVLMDMQMPVMDGLEATRRLRELPGYGQVPIIAMTANAFAEDRQHCMAAGMDDFIGKPANPDRLYRVLYRWLERGAR
ncbi:PAS domain S-box protein [Dechloromonas sp.]|uniref:PAS domain S-box protein n=1 Tax=Dechloromonas sp. TaxID=1917218 RepID=UPI00263F7929|nr:PAS domain S-box protein [Dechloromonas sp.]